MEREVLADVRYDLSINSFLFAILVDHINEEKVKICLNDFERKRRQFWNNSQPCFFCFSESELERALNYSYRPYIYSTGENVWTVDLKEIFGNYINSLTEEDLRLYYYEEGYAKIAYLYNWLQIDERIFDYPRNSVTSLLKCLWLFDSKEVAKHQEFLFKMAKKIKPDGDNIELLGILRKLREVECEEFITIDENGNEKLPSEEELEKLLEERINTLKDKVLCI